MAFHSTHRKGYQSKLLAVLSKGGRCNFWGLLECDDRRSPWWASRVGPQHDTVMISMNFNSYATLAIFFIIPVLFCFVFEHETIHTTRVLAAFDFYYFKTRTVHFLYSLRTSVSAHVRITSITAPGMFTNLCLVLLLLFADLPVPKFHFQSKKKKLGKTPRESRT